MLREIPRAAVDTWLRTTRLPIDLVLGALGREEAQVAVDRADATVRAVAGTALRDDALLEDAGRRQTAADNRAKALRLRTEAELRTERGEEQAEERRQQAQTRRRRATQQTKAAKERAEKERQQREREAKRAEQRRRTANDKAAAEAQETIDARNRKAKLEQLEAKSEALGEREAALTATDEAERLATAAAGAKAARKNGNR